jgi:hypothetical protein
MTNYNLVIEDLIKSNNDEINFCTLNKIENENDFNNYLQFPNNNKPDYITWLNVSNHIGVYNFKKSMKDLRAKRDKLLAATDYLALSDNTMTEEDRTYRQALRDITEGLTTKEQVEAVVFPTKP